MCGASVQAVRLAAWKKLRRHGQRTFVSRGGRKPLGAYDIITAIAIRVRIDMLTGSRTEGVS